MTECRALITEVICHIEGMQDD